MKTKQKSKDGADRQKEVDGCPLLRLPPELHLLIISHLPYPDALALKSTNRYFYTVTCADHELLLEWLIFRRTLHQNCPQTANSQCLLGSERDFCRGSIKLLMRARRRHDECGVEEGGRGCLVYGSKVCVWKERKSWFGGLGNVLKGMALSPAMVGMGIVVLGLGLGTGARFVRW